ncbi:hypothetical protein QTN47_20585 [Danxiaibacter flavus]|uniref:Uncharacterized protein n=1 Tax=Danxiaibacter flavus TaxID=3049108 RepID=A0ABV3ZJ90_9BACT|nr:hypothetical protein QNM32_20590 [Chitinophagaceae bacterium DXS]
MKTTISGTVVLNPDKSAWSHKISYPIVWTGWVGIEMVKIIQIELNASQESFVFEVFPDEYAFLKNKIARWICDHVYSRQNK